MPFDPKLRDRLCELEPQNPLLRERYAKELQAMLEKKLVLPMKVFLALVAVACIAIAIFLGTAALIHKELPALARVGLAGGGIFALAWAGLTAWSLRRGTFHLRVQPAAMAGLFWGLAVFMETCFLVLAPQFPDHFLALVALFCGLVILIGAGVMLTCTRVQQAELRMQELLLRLEYHVAELSETVAKSP
jgi:MFS family permease